MKVEAQTAQVWTRLQSLSCQRIWSLFITCPDLCNVAAPGIAGQGCPPGGLQCDCLHIAGAWLEVLRELMVCIGVPHRIVIGQCVCACIDKGVGSSSELHFMSCLCIISASNASSSNIAFCTLTFCLHELLNMDSKLQSVVVDG